MEYGNENKIAQHHSPGLRTGLRIWLGPGSGINRQVQPLIPPGPYRMSVRHPYLSFENKLFTLKAVQAHTIRVAAGKPVEAPTLELTFAPVPDLIPSKGILHDFNDQKARELDAFR